MVPESAVLNQSYRELRPCGISDIVLWLGCRLQRFRVVGHSMLPRLSPGDEVLVDLKAYCCDRPEPGDIVVAIHPQQMDLRMIKRVLLVRDNGDCLLVGDNRKSSTDSRILGAIPSHLIIGQVRCRFF